MTVDLIKDELNSHVGDKAVIRCNMGRNKFEKYDVVIKKLYNHIFTVEVNINNSSSLKSFSYSDVINKTIKIDYENLQFKK